MIRFERVLVILLQLFGCEIVLASLVILSVALILNGWLIFFFAKSWVVKIALTINIKMNRQNHT